jgi:hypothetical protein
MEKFQYSYHSKWFESSFPGYLSLKIPDCVKEEIKGSMSSIERGDVQTEDYRNKLVGNIKKEITFPVTPKLKYLVESLSIEWERIFLDGCCLMERHVAPSILKTKSWKYNVESLWINYSYSGDYNPIHDHFGAFSFVIWVDVPYNIEDEIEKYKQSKHRSQAHFVFHWTENGKIRDFNIPVDKKWNWHMVLFPATLYHSVNPFQTSDKERVSIAGNLYHALA